MQGNTLNSNPSTTFTTPLNTIHSSNDQHENTHHTISTLKTCQLLYTAPIQNQQQPHFVDFITQSSYDILCCILHHLDTESVATCTLVSHAWRDILIEIPSPWRHIVVSLGKSQNALTTVLPMVSNYIKKLSFFNNIYLKFGTMLQNIHSLITTYPFSNLSSLLISDQSSYRLNLSKYLYNILESVSNTLINLRIITPRAIAKVSLGRILTICQKLTSIELHVQKITDCDNNTDDDGDDTTLSISHITLLTEIILRPVKHTVSISHLERLFQYTPSLRSLILSSCTHEILPVINSKLPQLITLITDYESFVDTHPSLFQLPTPSSHQQQLQERQHNVNEEDDGFKYLALSPVRSLESIGDRLLKSAQSLRALYLGRFRHYSTDSTASLENCWRPLSSTIMYSLTHLYIDLLTSTTVFRNHLPAMLRSYPNLKSLRLQNCYDEDEEENDEVTNPWTSMETLNGIFDAVGDMKHLRKLYLVSFNVGCLGFLPCLERFGKEQQRCLQKLYIVGCHGVNSRVLSNSANITTLQELSVHNLGDADIVTSEITQFTQHVAEMSELTQLDIARIKLTDEAVGNIIACKTLKTLIMYNTFISEEGRVLLKQHINDVQIYNSNRFNVENN